MVTKLWIFPNGEKFNITQYEQELDRCMQKAQPQILTIGEHQVEPIGMINQGNDYAINVGQYLVQIFMAGRSGVLSKFGEHGTLQQDRVITLPQDARMVPILSSIDEVLYIFALIVVE